MLMQLYFLYSHSKYHQLNDILKFIFDQSRIKIEHSEDRLIVFFDPVTNTYGTTSLHYSQDTFIIRSVCVCMHLVTTDYILVNSANFYTLHDYQDCQDSMPCMTQVMNWCVSKHKLIYVSHYVEFWSYCN